MQVERTQAATMFHAVPSLAEAWLDVLEGEPRVQYPALRCVLVGGEAVPDALLRRLAQRFPQARIVELYGPTEATIVSTFHAAGASGAGVPHCIGRPFAGVRVYVLDQGMQPVPIGVPGELCIGGARIARGYWNRPELTAQRFVPSPFVAGDRLYKTGDLVRYLADGSLEYLGRNDFQVKIRGFRIELGEIEARLAQHPAVREAVVLAREDAGEKRLVAYYTRADSAEIDAEALRAHLSSSLPDYMVPAAYVALEALPLGPNGKLERKALPAPELEAYARHTYEAPAGEVERMIAQIWREVLGVEQVGRHDNFFELGGHSLLIVNAMECLRSAGLHVDMQAFFAASTLAELAETVTVVEEVRI